jgi:hypothetical protein
MVDLSGGNSRKGRSTGKKLTKNGSKYARRSVMINFQEFLADNGVHDFEDRLEHDIRKEDPRDWILNGLNWDKQPEKYDFWNDLDDDWVEICNKQEVKYGGEFPRIPEK